MGVIEEVDIKNMHLQTVEREERLLTPADTASGVVAVCAGEGTRRLFESLGAVCVEGGQSMNPSTAEIAAAIESLSAPGGDRAPEQRERDPGRRAGGRRE